MMSVNALTFCRQLASRPLATYEGLLLGISTTAALYAAILVVKRLENSDRAFL
ncbi:MAG: hypothetical protein KME38_17920 [Spirirestis rafaelensis WJT71-NPBG6]|jgi:cysteine synthase|nr:hypothetical protein [Spirirestis rafaelensis WJT71-NPBG6]